MDKEESIIQMLGSIFVILIYINDRNFQYETGVKYILIVLVLLIIQLSGYFIGRHERILNLIQVFMIIVFMKLGYFFTIILIPILSTKIITGTYKNILYFVCVGIMSIFMDTEYVFIFLIYSTLIYLYSASLNRKKYIENTLKDSYRNEREENYKLIQKLTYMENYRNHTKTMVKLNERSYIAQKLHDKLGHSVTSSVMQLQVTKAMMDKDKDLAIKYLNSAITGLNAGMDDIRNVLRDLKPEEQLIGIESIKILLLEFQSNCGVSTNISVSGDLGKVSTEQWIVIEDNLKEALTNSYKYSKATKVSMSIEIYNKFIRVEIIDNGLGCNKVKRGLGLRGMEERVKSIGGTIRFYNNDGFAISMIIGV